MLLVSAVTFKKEVTMKCTKKYRKHNEVEEILSQ